VVRNTDGKTGFHFRDDVIGKSLAILEVDVMKRDAQDGAQ
jgi:hypothetical protein